MQDIQDIFNRLQEKKKEVNQIRRVYKDSLLSVPSYEETLHKIQALQMQKKKIEYAIQEQMSAEFNKLETLKKDIEGDKQMLADIALSTMLKGETVKVVDEYNNEQLPHFKVTFKKT